MSKKKVTKEQLLSMARKSAKENEDEEETKLERVENNTYSILDDAFLIKDFNPIQYASAYFTRLEELRKLLMEVSALKWKNAKIVDEIVGISTGSQDCVVIGILFKEMKLKPAITLDMVSILGRNSESYINDSDTMIIEDNSARMKVLKNEVMDPKNFVTGTVIALKGTININGFFNTTDYTFCGVPEPQGISLKGKESMLVDEDQHLPLFSSLEKREFLIFVSGLEFGSGIERRLTERFSKWVLGEYGTKNDKLLSSRISRIIMGGGNIGEENQINDVIKGSFRTQEINERVYSNINSSLEYFESFVKQLSDSLSIDVMPGENDLSGSFLPQQPLNPALFPSLIDSSNIVFSTNPHKFSINNYDFLGTSGQNIQDICCFRSMEDMREVDVLYQTLEMRHIAPTCPDTLRSYPFESEDPLIIKEGVNVYFSCNAKEYGSIWEKNQLSVFTVPSFSKTKSFILLDLETLETYEYKFER